FQTYWVGGGILGVLLAGVIPGKKKGLEFALCALFVTLALDACRTKEQVPSVLLASASFAVTFVVVPEQALFFGMIGFIVLLAVRYVFVARKGKYCQRRAISCRCSPSYSVLPSPCSQCLLRCSSHCAMRRRSTSYRCGCPLASC